MRLAVYMLAKVDDRPRLMFVLPLHWGWALSVKIEPCLLIFALTNITSVERR
jgi:hypothetical protein